VIPRLVLGSLLVCSEHHARLTLANSLALQFWRLTQPTPVEGLMPLFSSAAQRTTLSRREESGSPSHEVDCNSNEKIETSDFSRFATYFATCAAY
jgi:hypothetical protein